MLLISLFASRVCIFSLCNFRVTKFNLTTNEEITCEIQENRYNSTGDLEGINTQVFVIFTAAVLLLQVAVNLALEVCTTL